MGRTGIRCSVSLVFLRDARGFRLVGPVSRRGSRLRAGSLVRPEVKDTPADGHHVRARLYVVHADETYYFPWRENDEGNGVTKTWDAYVSGPGNIF